MKHGIRRLPALWRASRLLRRWYHARFGAYPDWRSALAADSALWQSARSAAQGGPRVLMATAIGSHAHAITLESALAAAMTFRGAEVHALICDGAMSACAECEASFYPDIARFAARGPGPDLCRDCSWPAERVYADLGLKVHRYSDWLTPADTAEARRMAADVPMDGIRAFTLRWPGRRRARVRGHPAVFCDRLARIGARGRAGAAPLPRVCDRDRVRVTAPDARNRVHVGCRYPRYLCAVGHHGRGCARRRRARVDMERGLPQAAIHLQPRRYLPPHADDGAARTLGRPRADGGAGPRVDEVSRQPPGRAVRLDRLSPRPEAGRRRDREQHRAGPIAPGCWPVDERDMGCAASLSRQCVSEHRRMARPDVRVLCNAGRTCS